ncbi:MAG TPA: signal peptidase I [Nocardioides sp.]|nr:signal peptidase I [Nocardioides sp.]
MRARTADSFRETALTVGAGLGLVCLLLAVAAPLGGMRLLVFESGSMSPTVETGGVALTRTVPADDLAVGDIVSVIPPSGVRVTHRVVDIDRTGTPTLLHLRGDANEAPDPVPYPVTEADRVIVHVNHLGFVVDALASPYAVFAGGAFVAVLLMLAFGRRRPGRRAREARHRAPVAAAVVVAIALAGAGALMPARIAPTAAAFTDTAAASTGNLSSVTVPAPVVSCGTLIVGTTTLTWTPVARATGYTLHYGPNGSVTENVGPGVTSKSFSGLATSGVFSVEARLGSWSSATSNAKNYTVLLLLAGVCTNV